MRDWSSDVCSADLRIDRRRVILGAAVGVALMGGMLPIAADMFAPGLYVGAFLFGLAALPVYALSVAHMNDFVEPAGFFKALSGLPLLYTVGAIIGDRKNHMSGKRGSVGVELGDR